MTISTAPTMQQRLAAMAAAIHQRIPAAEVRLLARGGRAETIPLPMSTC